MSKHNYSQYSNKNANKQNVQHHHNQHEKPEVKSPAITTAANTETEAVVDAVAAPDVNLVKETVETVTLPTLVDGVVARCAKLNVREKPIVSSDIVCVLNAKSDIKVDVTKSTTNWFYVCTATGAEGYCMREYIDARV